MYNRHLWGNEAYNGQDTPPVNWEEIARAADTAIVDAWESAEDGYEDEAAEAVSSALWEEYCATGNVRGIRGIYYWARCAGYDPVALSALDEEEVQAEVNRLCEKWRVPALEVILAPCVEASTSTRWDEIPDAAGETWKTWNAEEV